MEKTKRKGEEFYRTGVFIREDDYREILEMTEIAKRVPVKRIKGAERKGLMPTMHRQAWHEVQCRINECAMKMGLTEMEGKYGLAKNGEFILGEDTTPVRKIYVPPPDFKVDTISAEDVERLSHAPERGEANPFDQKRIIDDGF